MHRGVDFPAPLGTPILAAADGTVAAAGTASGFGHWIVLDHHIGGRKVSTVYGHMTRAGLHVRPREHVTAGQHIADVGNDGQSTGPHLHLEVWTGGRIPAGTAVDPLPWL